jgi:lantibiotic modifying enzyme
MSWQPLFHGARAEPVLAALRDIADALEQAAPDLIDPSFGNGHASLALFFGYYTMISKEERHLDAAADSLSRACESLDSLDAVGFFNGLAGVAWTHQHLTQMLADEAPADLNEDIDRILARVVRIEPWNGHYDLIYGLVGIGLYALDHIDAEVGRDIAGQVVDRLAELSEPRDGGITWLTPLELIRLPALRERFPRGCYNLGLAHGVAGVIGLLARCSRADIRADKARELLSGAVTWLLANQRNEDGGSIFGGYAAPDEPSCRSAWCYGDPGIAAALLTAGRLAKNASWEREALAIAHRDRVRPPADTQVVDPMFCHGAAGLGHIFNRFYQATGDEAFAATARHWLERALEMRQPGKGLAGFASWWPEIEEWRGDAGLLGGTAGIGLCLLSAVSPKEPDWDRPMLLAIPGNPSSTAS